MIEVSVIIPTRNQRADINTLLSRILKTDAAGRSFHLEVIAVDGGSTDGTQETIKEWGKNHPVRLLTRDKETGPATAVLSGAEIANGDIIVAMDADLCHPPEKIPQLVEPIMAGSHDMVIGSRYAPGGSSSNPPVFEGICSRFTTFMARPLTDVRDPLSGFFAVRREILLSIPENPSSFNIGLELVVSHGHLLRIAEIPIEFHDRQKRELRPGFHNIGKYLRHLVILAGGNISITTGSRFAVVGFLGALIDFLTFNLLFAFGNGMGTAHIVSFFAATVSNFILNARWSFADAGTPVFQITLGKYINFLVIALLALFVRGGVLALVTKQWGWPPQAAVIIAIGAAALLNYIGVTFFVFPQKIPGRNPDIKWRILAMGIVGYSVLLRLVYLGLPELLHEEAYYWNYAQHLDIGYLDHPPMVAWMIWLTTALLGNTEFAVRLGAYLCWLITAVFIFGLTRNLFDKSTAFLSLMLLAVLPIFFGTGYIMTPDAPLIPCWAGALYFLERALIGERQTAWWGVGVCMGLGLLSKYTVALLAPATLLFLVMDSRSRKWFFSPRPYIAVLSAIVLFLPVIVWNVNHEWASFVFQGPRRIHGSFNFSLDELILFVIILLTPTGAVTAFYILFKKNRGPSPVSSGVAAQRRRFALVFILFPLSVFFIFSIARNVKLSWTGPLWLMIVPLMAYSMKPEAGRQTKGFLAALQRAWPATIVITMLIFGMTLHYVVLGLPGIPHPENFIPDWQKIARHIEDIEKEIENKTGLEPLVVGMDKYRTASQLAFYRTKIKKNQLENDGVLFTTSGRHLFGDNSLMYAYWFPKHKVGKGPMILVSLKHKDLLNPSIPIQFDKIGKIQINIIKKNGIPIARYYYRIAEGYRSFQS